MPPPTDGSRHVEQRFWQEVAARNAIRVSVRALVILDDHILVQRGNHSDSVRWFPGGELELGEMMESGLRRELAEETSIRIKTVTYRFVANNRFEREGQQFHLLEHYFEVTPQTFDVESIEEHFDHEWIPITAIDSLDVRPFGVRDLLGVPSWRNTKLLEVS